MMDLAGKGSITYLHGFTV